MAKKKAKIMMEDTEAEQYAKIYDYCEEIRTNIDYTSKIEVDRPQIDMALMFKRPYVCLDACR